MVPTMTLDDLELGEEIRGGTCPADGETLVLRNGKPWCDWHSGYVALESIEWGE